jgi:hypothetical protein
MRRLLKLFEQCLIAIIKYCGGTIQGVGMQTDVPTLPLHLLESGPFYSDLNSVFVGYTGKLGHYVNLVDGYNGTTFSEKLIEDFGQNFIYDSIESVRENGGGVMLLATEGKYTSLMNLKNRSFTRILGIYLDELSTAPDILIKISSFEGYEQQAICLAHNNKATAYVVATLSQILKNAQYAKKKTKTEQIV